MSSVDAALEDTARLRLMNFGASAAVVVLACLAYSVTPYGRPALERWYGPEEHALSGYHFIQIASALYIGVLGIFFLRLAPSGEAKSLRFFRTVARWIAAPVASFRTPVEPADRVAVLTTLLKSYYGPMMSVWLMIFCMDAWANGLGLLDSRHAGADVARSLFDSFGYWFILQVILFVDVLVFTFGYLIELPRLRNEIRSVDPTLMGWAVALLCYPPFNTLTTQLIGAQHTDFPHFDNTTVHFTLNLTLLGLMAIYSSASVALGFKASNLTHRGIVTRGPYAVIRHPAYACKNLAWWIGSIPFVVGSFHASWFEGLRSAGSVLAWTALYVLRALTEEDHLRTVDGEYDVYAARVKYRFIPGLI